MYIPTETGQWVSEEFCRLAEVVKDYDPWLELRWIPTDKRTRDDKKPYVIVDTRSDYPVFYASELDTPTDILAKLFESNLENGDVLQKLEARNAAAEILQKKAYLDQLEEAAEMAEFMMKSPLNWMTMNGKKFDDQRRIIGSSVEKKVL